MIEWSEQALRQLDLAYDFIASSNSEVVADRIRNQIFTIVERLESFPMLGRMGRIEGTRELVVPNTPFVAAYEIYEARIYILAILHGAQRWPDVF